MSRVDHIVKQLREHKADTPCCVHWENADVCKFTADVQKFRYILRIRKVCTIRNIGTARTESTGFVAKVKKEIVELNKMTCSERLMGRWATKGYVIRSYRWVDGCMPTTDEWSKKWTPSERTSKCEKLALSISIQRMFKWEKLSFASHWRIVSNVKNLHTCLYTVIYFTFHT